MTATDLDALLAAVRREPADNTVRLAYADCLEERGDRWDRERARFVREYAARPDCSVEAFRHPEYDDWRVYPSAPGRLALFRGLADAVRAGCPPAGWFAVGAGLTFRRGFAEHVACTAAEWVRHGPAAVRSPAAAVESVTLTDRAPLLAPGVGRRAWLADDAFLGQVPEDCRVGPLFRLLPKTPGYADNLRVYESADLALDALSAAALRHAWEGAGG